MESSRFNVRGHPYSANFSGSNSIRRAVSTRGQESATRKELLKPDVVTKGIPFGVDGKKYEVNIPSFVGAIETRECLIRLAESGMHQREGVGRNVALAFHRLESTQHFARCLGHARPGKNIAPAGQRLAIAATQSSRSIEDFEG
jgi:hypothetical protein